MNLFFRAPMWLILSPCLGKCYHQELNHFNLITAEPPPPRLSPLPKTPSSLPVSVKARTIHQKASWWERRARPLPCVWLCCYLRERHPSWRRLACCARLFLISFVKAVQSSHLSELSFAAKKETPAPQKKQGNNCFSDSGVIKISYFFKTVVLCFSHSKTLWRYLLPNI